MPHRLLKGLTWLKAFPKRHIVALMGTFIGAMGLLFILDAEQLQQKAIRVKPIEVKPPVAPILESYSPDIGARSSPLSVTKPAVSQPETGSVNRPTPASPPAFDYITVRPGDTLSDLFAREGLGAKWVLAVLEAQHGNQLRRLVPGDRLGFITQLLNDDAPTKALSQLRFHSSLTEYIDFSRDDNQRFSSSKATLATQTLTRYAEGTILNSLFYDANKAGLSEKTIMEFAGLFAWDIDFALDLREGDQFRILYKEVYFKGEKIRDGEILVAEFINQGKVFRALRFEDSQGDIGYYTPEGRSVKKAFMRTPVDFARITSRFNLRRKHPVLHTIRAHKGVDYAASSGTPVKATGNGKVMFIGRKGGYGKVVILQHGVRYTTLYAHMRGFQRGLKKGTRVQQGQVIGYVGSTGLASGPHLHYEFRVDGVHRDPLRVSLPQARPIARQERQAFTTQVQQLFALLEAEQKNLKVATNDG